MVEGSVAELNTQTMYFEPLTYEMRSPWTGFVDAYDVKSSFSADDQCYSFTRTDL